MKHVVHRRKTALSLRSHIFSSARRHQGGRFHRGTVRNRRQVVHQPAGAEADQELLQQFGPQSDHPDGSQLS